MEDESKGLVVLRSLDSASCDACAEPAVTVLAIGRAGGNDLLRMVCQRHLDAALSGARAVPLPVPRGSRSAGSG